VTFKPLFDQFAQLNWLEVVGFLTGIWGVWLAGREKIWTWPVGLVNVIVSGFIFYNARLYADAPLPVVRAGWKLLTAIVLSGLAMTVAAGFMINRLLPDAALPYLDSLVAVFGMLTTLLMARKVLQCWHLWFVIDLLCAGIYWYKGLYLYSLLYLVFCGQVVFAYYAWRGTLMQQQMEPGE
jgi:nicotinamide mononucleotide transporter